MLSLILALLRLARAVARAGKDPEFRALCAILLVLLLGGTLFYVQIEGWSYLDATYFCVMTMSTVGYGDLAPTTGLSKVFTIVYSVMSIGVFVAVASKLAAALLDKRRSGIRGSNESHPPAPDRGARRAGPSGPARRR